MSNISRLWSLRRYDPCFQHQINLPNLWLLTFVAISDRVEVNVVGVAAEEEQAEPGLEGVDGNDEKNPDDPSLLGAICVATKVLVDLKRNEWKEFRICVRIMCVGNVYLKQENFQKRVDKTKWVYSCTPSPLKCFKTTWTLKPRFVGKTSHWILTLVF